MALPAHTISGRRALRHWLEIQVGEIEREGKYNPENAADWIHMFKELMEYTFTLEDRLTDIEFALREDQ